MSAPDDDDSIKVYCTVVPALTEDAICELLRSDVVDTVERVKEQFAIIFMPGQRPLHIVQHQRHHYQVPNYSQQSYFLIVDSANAAADGVLLCTTKASHGFPDAVRNTADMAGMTAASLAIANSDWTEVREGTWHEQQPPVRRLAVYDNRRRRRQDEDRDDDDGFDQLADAVDAGLHYVNDEGELPLPLLSSSSPRSIDCLCLFRYTAISPRRRHQQQQQARDNDSDELVRQHRRHVDEKEKVDPRRFAVVDNRLAAEGVLLIQTEPREELRCKLPAAGELLYWNAIGFMDWKEMREFASKYSNFSQC